MALRRARPPANLIWGLIRPNPELETAPHLVEAEVAGWQSEKSVLNQQGEAASVS